MSTEQKVTEEQASAALMEILANAKSDDGDVMETAPSEPAAESSPAPETAAEPKPEPVAAEPAQTESSDDVESLKARLKEADDRIAAAEKRAAERAAAIQSRSAQNERIIRDRMLQKATVSDRALKVLQKTRTKDGATEEEVDAAIRAIEGTLNPNSPSYTPPAPVMNQEDQAIVLNNFLNEKAMDTAEADEFGRWIRSEASTKMSPIEQELAGRDLDGFLRLAHVRFGESLSEKAKQTKQVEAVEAVKSVQRTQKEAARAASSSPAAIRTNKTSPANQPIDVRKLSRSDISTLLRQSVEQYKS